MNNKRKYEVYKPSTCSVCNYNPRQIEEEDNQNYVGEFKSNGKCGRDKNRVAFQCPKCNKFTTIPLNNYK